MQKETRLQNLSRLRQALRQRLKELESSLEVVFGRTPLVKTQIKILSEQGHSIRTIARVLRLSRRTVRKYLEGTAEPPACALADRPSESSGWVETVDWEYVRQEVYGKGTTVKQIQREVAPEIAYVKFWRQFREKVSPQASPDQVTIRLH